MAIAVPFTGAGMPPKTPAMASQPTDPNVMQPFSAAQTPTTIAAPTAAPAAPTAQAPTGSEWIQQLAPGTTYNAQTQQATVPLPWGGSAPLDPSAYSLVNGQTYLTPQQYSDFLATAPYNPSSAVNPQNVSDYAQMLQGIMAPVTGAQNALNAQQLQTYTDAEKNQMAMAQQAASSAKLGLQTDEANQMGGALGAQGSQSSYEEGKIASAYAPQFANLESGLAADLTSITSAGTDAIKTMQLNGQSEQAQQTAGIMQSALSYLQSNEAATTDERQGILNYFQTAGEDAAKNNLAQATLNEKINNDANTAQYHQGMLGVETQRNADTLAAAQAREEYASGSPNNPSATQYKMQTEKATGLAQQQINTEWQTALGAAVKELTNGHNKLSVARLNAIKQTVAQQLASEVSNQGGALSKKGISVDDMINYVNQLAGQAPTYTSAGNAASSNPTLTESIKLAQTDPNFTIDTAAQQQVLIQQYMQMLQAQGGS